MGGGGEELRNAEVRVLQIRTGSDVFDVVAKFCTVATNFLKFCIIGSDGVAFVLGASGVLGWDCDAGEGRI